MLQHCSLPQQSGGRGSKPFHLPSLRLCAHIPQIRSEPIEHFLAFLEALTFFGDDVFACEAFCATTTCCCYWCCTNSKSLERLVRGWLRYNCGPSVFLLCKTVNSECVWLRLHNIPHTISCTTAQSCSAHTILHYFFPEPIRAQSIYHSLNMLVVFRWLKTHRNNTLLLPALCSHFKHFAIAK